MIDRLKNKKNIKLYRTIQKIVNPNIVKNKKYEDVLLENIPIRIFDPHQSDKIIIYIHGGGWVSGTLDTHSNICYKLADELKRKVISIGYRLAPEYPYPTGFNDCYFVIKNIMDNTNWNNVLLMGDSAGGNLAMGISLKALHQKDFRCKKLILIYPATQTDYTLNSKYVSLNTNSKKGFLTRKILEDYINMYLPDEYKMDQYVNLLQAKKLFGLPKTMIVTGTNDPLHDEGVCLVKKLKRHLVSVVHYDLKDAYHGYFTNIFDKKYTTLTIELIKGFIGDKSE